MPSRSHLRADVVTRRRRLASPAQPLESPRRAPRPPSAGCPDSRRGRRRPRADEDRLVARRDAGQPRAPVHEGRDHAEGQRGLAKLTSKRPPTTAGSSRARAMAGVAPGGSTRVGVQEQEHVAPRGAGAGVHLACAPALARDRRAEARRAPPRAVRSWLPPSTTMISASGHSDRRDGAAGARDSAASSSTGTMTLSTSRSLGRVRASQRAKRRFTSGVRRLYVLLEAKRLAGDRHGVRPRESRFTEEDVHAEVAKARGRVRPG